MDQLLILLQRIMGVVDRFRTMEQRIPGAAMLVFGLLAAFGLLNCLLGYRLMRFWMMLFGFLAGAGCGFAAAWFLEVPTQDRRTYLIIMLAAGAGMALITFFFYRAGIFLMAAFLGVVLSIYLVHPTSSATFFVCLLIGVLLGIGSFRYDREVIILITALFGGTLAGYSTARIFHLQEIPYGVFLCVGFAAAGMAIQLATNRRTPPEPDAESDSIGEDGQEWEPEEENPEETSEELERQNRRENEEFYEQYFRGADVFDSVSEENRMKEENRRTKDRKKEAQKKEAQKREGQKKEAQKKEGRKKEQDMPLEEETDIHLLAWNEKKRRGKP